MYNCDLAQVAISALLSYESSENECTIQTMCIYPSGASVPVILRRKADFIEVTDDGYGLREIISNGINNKKPGYYLGEYARHYGIEYYRGSVRVRAKDERDLTAAIILVANASKDAVAKTLDAHRPSMRPNFRFEFDSFIKEKFEKQFSKQMLMGQSGKLHTVDYFHAKGNVIEVRINDKFVVIDPIIPDTMTIAVKGQMHRDIYDLGYQNSTQLLIYNDDIDDWNRPEKNLLMRWGVQTITFSELERELPALVA